MTIRLISTSFAMNFLCFFIVSSLLNFSCAKDSDTLSEGSFNEDTVSLVEQDSTKNDKVDEAEEEEEAEPKEDSEEDRSTSEPCLTSGGKAGETGLKTWCWGDINVPSGTSNGRDSFSDGQLALNIECSANQVIQEDNRLKFILNPQNPSPASWCNNDYNMRAEIRTMPWQVNQPLGTEEWIGWSYTFGDDYKIDHENPWLFFQMQQGVPGSPPHELAVVPSSLYGAQNGEVVVINHANKTETDRSLTGVVPKAGETLNIVVHVVHDLGSKGLLQIWINGNMVYNKQVGTVYESAPWGGNAKFGIYKWPWRESAGVQKSLNQGIDHLEIYMGTLRILTRRPGDTDYMKDSYNEVQLN